MKKIFTFLLGFYTLTNLSAQAPNLSAEAWRADIRFLTEQISSLHPNPFHRFKAADFQARAEAISKEAGAKNSTENALELMKLLAGIGDGNTHLDWETLDLKRYPLQFKQFGDQLRVVAVDSTYRRWLGLHVLRIDQYTWPEMQEKLLALVPADESRNYAYRLMERYLRYPEVLDAVGATGARFNVIMFENEEGIRIKAPLLAQEEEPDRWFKVQENPPAHLIPPYDAIHPGLWATYLTDEKVNFLYAKDYPSDKKSWATVAKQLKKKFKDNPSAKVLIDLRENETDQSDLGKKVFKLAAKGADRVYVAIGPQTYAAATLDALLWRDKYGAILVGETTGANPNGYRENKTVTLPNSGIRLFIPTKAYQVLDNHVGGLEPDHQVPMDWESYQKGIDPVLEWVQRQ